MRKDSGRTVTLMQWYRPELLITLKGAVEDSISESLAMDGAVWKHLMYLPWKVDVAEEEEFESGIFIRQ